MTSKRVLVGLGALAGIGLVTLLGAALDWWVLVALGVVAMIGVLGVITLNTNVLVRAHRTAFDRSVRTGGAQVGVALTGPATVPVSETDLAGALRLIQAQYVGRLDRAQSTLERAAASLATAAPASMGGTGDPLAALPEGSVVVLHKLDDAAFDQARAALERGLSVHAIVKDSVDRERLADAGLADRVTTLDPDIAAPFAVTVALPGSSR